MIEQETWRSILDTEMFQRCFSAERSRYPAFLRRSGLFVFRYLLSVLLQQSKSASISGDHYRTARLFLGDALGMARSAVSLDVVYRGKFSGIFGAMVEQGPISVFKFPFWKTKVRKD